MLFSDIFATTVKIVFQLEKHELSFFYCAHLTSDIPVTMFNLSYFLSFKLDNMTMETIIVSHILLCAHDSGALISNRVTIGLQGWRKRTDFLERNWRYNGI